MLPFLPLAPILLLLTVSVAMLIVRLLRPRFSYFWLVAALGALAAWPQVLLSRLVMPRTIALGSWQPEYLFPSSPYLIVDGLSWPYAVALATLVLAVILTDVARAAEADWSSWAATLALAALGLFAVLSGNLLTILLAWAAIDLVELLIYIGHIEVSSGRERVVLAFAARAAAIMLILWPAQSSLPALLAVGLRLGVLPPHMAYFKEPVLRRGLGTMVRLVPAAASLVLLARVTSAGISPELIPYLLLLLGLAAIYSGFSWLVSGDELDGRPFWISGMAALALASTLRGQPVSSLAWGVACLFSGGLLFLTSSRQRGLFLLLSLGLLGFSTLPLTPAWDGVRLYAPPFSPLLLLFLAAHVLLLAGYIRHTFQPGQRLVGVERWVLLIYPLGLSLLPITHFVVGDWGWVEAIRQGGWQLNFIQLWPGLLAGGLALFLVLSGRRRVKLPAGFETVLGSVFSIRWLYRLLWEIYRNLGRLLSLISRLLEGEGGVLWALLLLTLLLAFFVQGGLGDR